MEAEVGCTVQEILTTSLGVSRRMVQKLTRASGIRLNGRAAYLQRKVRVGDVVAARISHEEDPGLDPVQMPLQILHEDDQLLVVDKPAGLLVHPVGTSSKPTLAHGIAHHLLQAGTRTRVRPVHRLDRDTSGLLIVAKSAFAHQALDRQLRNRELKRTYLAFVEGSPSPPEQVIDSPIGRHPRDPSLRAVVERGGDPALTRFELLEPYPDAALLEVQLDTGRTHQIRVHLAHIGHPLLGDVRYGAAVNPLPRQALHASKLAFHHPLTGAEIELKSALPDDLEDLRTELRR